jgi:hypothetical protein
MAAKAAKRRIKIVDITQENDIIANAGVPIYVRRRGKVKRTSCVVGMEIVLACIESIQTPKELATVRGAVAFAKKNMNGRKRK